ncbi:MAG: hypothetical protein P4L85_05060 [Paludisphaera borealis]|uniref:hypothetical protein n=1 Tax=Paludisphaera borealis TaxID=1387353 RepID=UPI00283AFB13|nr:hypothetical protein [Paludisphaera borealis]MDR3618700.1 hypothetical protein [Paludisphaera borealis]
MPPRLVSVAILIYWSIAAFWLLTWEVLPELSLGYPPDLRSITAAGDDSKPVTWAIDVIDDPLHPDVRRSVGQAVTSSKRLPDGGVELSSQVVFDAGELLKRMPLSNTTNVRLNIASSYRVDSKGNLQGFDMKVTNADLDDGLVTVKGRLKGPLMEVTATGMVPALNRKMSFPYEPRGVVHDALRPFDRLPGLHVGQRWDTRMINPFTGAVEVARVEVKRRGLIDWNGEAVSGFEVEQHAGPVTAKAWVRLDGVIIRQEVPLPFLNMVLERLPDETSPAPVSEAKGAP